MKPRCTTPPLRRLATGLAAWLAAGATALAAVPVQGGCAAAPLVEPALRDAALQMLQRLAVQAPGQPRHGALRHSLAAGHVDGAGRAWQQVSAYQANLAVLGALAVDAPGTLPLAADWLRWQARHAATGGASAGVVLDHWVREGQATATPCPPDLARSLCHHVDADDSTAASLLLLADAMQRQGADAVLAEAPVRNALAQAAAAIERLTLGDGLTLAKPLHRVVYTMDQVEVLAARLAWGRLLRALWADEAGQRHQEEMAARLATAMQERLWQADAGWWRVSLGTPARPRPPRWYPDTMAQAWPLLWGVGDAQRNAEAWRRAIQGWQQPPLDWSSRSVDPDGFWWPAVAVAARCTGDDERARAWLARARSAWLGPAGFAPPFHIGDLLWLLWLAPPVARP
tara:strand:- start:636 stop:1835 length:1200 start_codon:yes stop_codon:yes gene_type:complete